MSINPDLQRQIDNLEDAGYSCDPEGHESLSCACGYSGPPAAIIDYGEVDEIDSDAELWVCPGCGDA